jgi:serine-type D-Ala-D-Ala carboxypeptidase/endopeptidase (penicillin-binding protein 4)
MTTVLCLVTLVAGAAPIGEVTTNSSLPELCAQLDAWVNAPRFSGALWSVKIASLDTGRTLFEYHPDRLMSPASNSKLYTGALALDTLGGDYHFITPIRATAKVDTQGTLAGDLIISGCGDPSWKAPRFATIFDPFVAALTKAGVKVVTGNLVADNTFFHGSPTGGSWCVEDVTDSEGAPISALTLADNAADIHVAPGTNVGESCRITLDPPGTVLNLVNLTQTVPAGELAHLELSPAAGTNDFYLLGQLPRGGSAELLDTGVAQPARWFGSALKVALASHGIVIQGDVEVLTWPDRPLWKPADLYPLGAIQSPPLRDLVHAFMKPSQNLETDLVFDHVGELTRGPGTPDWVTSEELAVRALDDFLEQHAIPADVHFDEGSGMSRNNLTSANATVALLTVMATNRWAADYYAALPIAGVDGTLRNRMRSGPAFGKVHAKTGTLRWVNSLSGYVTSAAGEKLVFSLMLNRYAAPPDRRRTDELDEIAAMLAAFQGRSDE